MSLLQVNALQSTDNNAIAVRSNLMMEAGYTIGYGASDIGAQGSYGFGTAPYPYAVPQDFSPMVGTYDTFHENYGNYEYVDGSTMAWIPRFYYRIGNTSSPRYTTFGVNAIDIAGDFTFTSEADANASGYALHRAFVDGGQIKKGFFCDKFHWSNNAGKASSIKNRDPMSCHSSNNPWGSLTGGPANNFGGAFAAAKTRGGFYNDAFFPLFRHQFAALAMLSRAHAQAVTSTTTCAWYSADANFPKGNNNYRTDYNDSAITFTASDSFTGPAKTGSGEPFAKTTHNGQKCGIADLNGNLWHVTPGMTSNGTGLYILKQSVAAKDLNYTSMIDLNNYDLVTYANTNSLTRFGNGLYQVFSGATSGAGLLLTGMGLPLADGVSSNGTNQFGHDGFWNYRPNEMCPVSGGDWGNGANAGVWALGLYGERGDSYYSVGARSGLYL